MVILTLLMKRSFGLFILCIVFFSCVGKKEPPQPDVVLLFADKQTVDIDTHEEIHFSVLCNDVDITENAVIRDVSDKENPIDLAGHSVFLTEEKVYEFDAFYNGTLSPVVRIEAYSSHTGQEKGQSFYRRSLVTDFTATWCVNCPNMSDAIHRAKDEYPDRIVEIAVHYLDEFEIPEGAAMVSSFNINAFPTTLVDMDPVSKNSVASSTLLLDRIRKSMGEAVTTCGLKVSSHTEDRELIVDIEVTIAEDNDYKLAVLLVRDGIVAPQTGGGDNYVHSSVVSRSLNGSLAGDVLGTFETDDIVSRQYRCLLNDSDLPEKMRVVTYLLGLREDGTYTVNNTVSCPANDSVGYRYEK